MNKKWKRIGECNRCGDCCRDFFIGLLINPDENPKFTEDEMRWFNYHEKTEAVMDTDSDGNPIKKIKIKLKCKNLIENPDGTTSCKIYPNRPDWFCKQFPYNPMELKDLPRCGFKFIQRKKAKRKKNGF